MNKEKEEKLRELMYEAWNSPDSFDKCIELFRSNFAREYHTTTVDLTELRSAFFRWNDNGVLKSANDVWEWFSKHIKPKQDKENDDIKFLHERIFQQSCEIERLKFKIEDLTNSKTNNK